MADGPSILADVTVDLRHRELRLFTEDQVKRAFWEHFHKKGEIFFDYLGSPEKNEASTADEWQEFAGKLREQPIVALQAVDYFALLGRVVRLAGIHDLAARPGADSITDTEWAELQRLAGEGPRG